MLYDSTVTKLYENNKKITLMSIAVPKFFEAIFTAMISTVNTMMLSGYSENAVSATNVSAQIINLVTVLANMIITGTVLRISIELGREDRTLAKQFSGTGGIMCTTLSLLAGILLCCFANEINETMHLSGVQKAMANDYLKIMAIFFPITALKSYFSNILICAGYAKYSLVGGIVSNILNCAFGYTILYGPFNLPVESVCAVALGSVAAQTVGLVLVIIFCVMNKCPLGIEFVPMCAVKILKLGVSSGMCSLSYNAAQMITTGFIVSLGDVVLNTKVYVSNVVLYTQQISLALGSSGAVFMGRYRGMNQIEKIKTLFRQNLVIAVCSNFLLSFVLLVFRKNIIGIFTDNEMILKMATVVLLIDIAVEVARAVNHISEQALNANADVKTTFFASVLSCWLFSVLLSYVLGIKLNLGLAGCWIAFAADEMFKASLYLIRWRSGKWQKTGI